MMKPKEKANQLYTVFGDKAGYCVNEILNTIYNEDFEGHLIDEKGANEYWIQVIEELLIIQLT